MMQPNVREILIGLLAATDALFEPVRNWADPRHIAGIGEQQTQFRTRGLRIDSMGGDASARKEHERRLDEIEQTKLVIFSRRGGKRTFWRLTDSADWALRRFCTCSDYQDTLTILYAVRCQADAGCCNSGIVPDWTLACGPHRGDKWSENEKWHIKYLRWASAAALCRGWLMSWSDRDGANGYHITDLGRSFLANPVEPQIEWPDYDDAANDRYLDALQSATSRFRA